VELSAKNLPTFCKGNLRRKAVQIKNHLVAPAIPSAPFMIEVHRVRLLSVSPITKLQTKMSTVVLEAFANAPSCKVVVDDCVAGKHTGATPLGERRVQSGQSNHDNTFKLSS